MPRLTATELRHAAKFAVVTAAYFGSAKLGLELAHMNSSVTAVWPPTGIALAALLVWGYRLWPAVALGAFLANSWTGVPLVTVIGITAGNTLEALVGSFLLRRVADFRPSLERVRDVLALALLAGALSTAVSATIGVLSLSIGNELADGDLAATWRVWWLGDMGGDLLLAPFLLICAQALTSPGRQTFRTSFARIQRRGRAVEAVMLLALLVGITVLVFSNSSQLTYLVLPPLAWAGLRFAQLGAATASLVVAGIAVGFTAAGNGPFGQEAPDSSLLLSQTFNGVAALTALLMAALTSQRRQAEASLRRAHDDLELKVRERTGQLLRSRRALELQGAITANMEEGAVLVDASRATIIYANPSFERMFGYEPGELEGQPISIVNAAGPKEPEEVKAEIVSALEERGIWSGEIHNVKKDGTEFWCRASISTFRYPEVEEPVWVSVQADITDEKQRMQALSDSEARLAEAQRVARVGSWEWNVAENTVTWSDELCRIHGLERHDFAGTFEAFLASVHPDDREFVDGIVRKAFANRSGFDYEHRCLRPDGEVRVLRARGKVVVDERNELVRMLGVCQDVTELREAERSLHRLAAIVESSHDAIFSTTPSGTIETWNPGAEQVYGYSAEEIVGRSVAVLAPPHREGEEQVVLEKVLAGEQVVNFETQHLKKNGAQLDAIVTVSPIKDEDGAARGCAFISGDVTEQNRIRREADRAKDEFLANVSHELRTPLTAMIGYTHLLLEGVAGELTSQQQDFLEIAERNAKRQLRLVGDLLLVAKAEVGKFGIEFGPVELAGLVSELIGAALPVAEAQQIQVSSDLRCRSTYQGDADRLAQLVDNLLSNALKFTPRGGSVDVTLLETERDVVLEVRNSGSYIPPTEREQVFERFFRGAQASEDAIAGVGLGLTICKAIVAGHGGTIGVESSEEGETTFRVELPLQKLSERPRQDSNVRPAA